MAYDFFETLAAAKSWAAQAAERRDVRVSAEHSALLEELGQGARPPELTEAARPLLAAFIGGAGVGKSSLLNRLAGAEVAKAGAERPTSREVTVYLHADAGLESSLAKAPLARSVMRRHQREELRALVCLDLPDFDSVEPANRQLVFDWLPFVDVLIYVVSPERYRDAQSWRILRAEGWKHAWLFVMNQWDRGVPEQLADFERQLALAGFQQPLIFCCSCLEPEGDDFNRLLEYLPRLAEHNNAAALAWLQARERARRLRELLDDWRGQLRQGDFTALRAEIESAWQQQIARLEQGMAWPLSQLARAWAGQPGQIPQIETWDAWARDCFADAVDEIYALAQGRNLAGAELRAGLAELKTQAALAVPKQIEFGGRQGLLHPGNAGQRLLARALAACEALLPLAAMAAVAYAVYGGFWSGLQNQAFLGVDFAVHAGLLIGLSWLLPYFLHKKLQPSLEKAALAGLRRGLRLALAEQAVRVEQLLAAEERRREMLSGQLLELVARCEAETVAPVRDEGLLERVLL